MEVALSSTAASTSAYNSVDNGSSRSSSARGDAAGGVGISVDHTIRPFADGKLLPFFQDVQLFGAYGVEIAALVITADIATFVVSQLASRAKEDTCLFVCLERAHATSAATIPLNTDSFIYLLYTRKPTVIASAVQEADHMHMRVIVCARPILNHWRCIGKG